MEDKITDFDKQIMRRCIQLAKNGLGTTYPNPMVGCVIVYNRNVIAEGWHKRAGGAHAEVNAVSQIENKEILKDCEIFVSLEPCSHFGKTPPCSDMIIRYNFKRVVVGTTDPNSKVNGAGIQKMRNAGICVQTDVLKDECVALNKRFFCFHQNKRPYIILKWAETADGFMATADGKQRWITNQYSKQLVHKWRAEEQAILVGYNTATIDNPQLNARLWSGNHPVRIVFDRDLSLSQKLNLFDKQQHTIVFSEFDSKEGAEVIKINFDNQTEETVLEKLYEIGIQSLIIEGGRKTLDGFITKNLWDEARVFSSNENWGNGIKSPCFTAKLVEQKFIGLDNLKIYKR